jgi:hypothetical protein
MSPLRVTNTQFTVLQSSITADCTILICNIQYSCTSYLPNWLALCPVTNFFLALGLVTNDWQTHFILKSSRVILRPTKSPSLSWCQAPTWDKRPIIVRLFKLFLDNYGFFDVGRPPWREVGSAVFIWAHVIDSIFEYCWVMLETGQSEGSTTLATQSQSQRWKDVFVTISRDVMFEACAFATLPHFNSTAVVSQIDASLRLSRTSSRFKLFFKQQFTIHPP